MVRALSAFLDDDLVETQPSRFMHAAASVCDLVNDRVHAQPFGRGGTQKVVKMFSAHDDDFSSEI
jgi:hypothetical protein